MSIVKLSAVLLGSFVLIFSTAAQPAQRGGAGNFRGTAGAGFNAKHTQDQLAAIQEQLGTIDEDWKTLSPKVEKVIVAKQNMNTGAGMNWTASNNAKPTFEASKSKPDTAPGKAMQGVRDALVDDDATAEQLEQKMAAARAARQKARENYEAAQNDLIDEITPRQQAVLMTLGVIE